MQHTEAAGARNNSFGESFSNKLSAFPEIQASWYQCATYLLGTLLLSSFNCLTLFLTAINVATRALPQRLGPALRDYPGLCTPKPP